MIDLVKYDFFIFDCDGVILDSNLLKTCAFVDSLPKEPNKYVKKLVQYHKNNGGISRYKKFKYYFENIKKSENSEKEINLALERFALIVKKGLLKSKFIPGVLRYIKKLNANKIQVYVVSGSDEKELKEVFNKIGIIKLFNDIFGSPKDKFYNTRKVTKKTGKNKKGIFFGDSKSDYQAAIKNNIDFVFVKGKSEWKDGYEIMKEKNIKIINNFKGL